MYNIIKTTVTISMIQKIQFTMFLVHNKLKKNKQKKTKKRKSCRQDHICLIVIQSNKLMVFGALRQSCCCVSWLSRYGGLEAVLTAVTTSRGTDD